MKFIAVITAWHVTLHASIVEEISAASEAEALGLAHGIASKRVDAFCSKHVTVIPIADSESIKRTQLTMKERLTGLANI